MQGRSKFDQLIRYRLVAIADAAESGFTELTGKIRREGGTEGEVIGRWGGMKQHYPELRHIRESPKQIAQAIRKGSGPLYSRLTSSVQKELIREGVAPGRKRAPGVPSVASHSGKKSCTHCGQPHTTDQHRFHGPGSFHATHLWAFNPKRDSRAPVMIYGRVLMISAQKTQPHANCDSECKRCDHCYIHEFKQGAVMWGLPNGDLLIRSNRK